MNRVEKIVCEMEAEIENIERDKALRQATNFGGRVQAIDRLQDDVIEPIEDLLAAGIYAAELTAARQHAEVVSGRLEDSNKELVRGLRTSIRSGRLAGKDLQRRLEAYAGRSQDEDSQNIAGYDSLDSLVSSLLLPQAPPRQAGDREPEMVFYQPTPARLILKLVETADFRQDDVFYDLGSGLGQVVLLVNLLGNVRAVGIEFEPAYCEYALQCARALNLSAVEFVAADVREADISDGTVFFMYTPFEGKMLEQVLERLRVEATGRTIRIYTYGPCTLVMSKQAWLNPLDRDGDQVYRLAAFESVEGG